MSYLDHIRHANNAQIENYLPYFWRDRQIGWIRRDRIAQLEKFSMAFRPRPDRIELSAELDSYVKRSATLGEAVSQLAAEGVIRGWRDEKYPITDKFGATPLAEVERAAASFLGIRSRGIHLNGFVRDGEDLKMWVATRARNKPTYPGLLDNMVAGGQPLGLGFMENLIKEGMEEAGLPGAMTCQAKAVGAIGYFHQGAEGLKPDQIFCYDLELSADFQPVNTDGEVEKFELMPISKVREIVQTSDRFKYNCNLCIIDFLIRHGLLTPDDDPDYLEICLGLKGHAMR